MQNDRVGDLDGLVRCLVVERSVRATYENLGLDVPESLSDRIDSLENRIRRMVRGELKAKLAELKARKEALTPTDIKLKKVDDEIAELEKKLA